MKRRFTSRKFAATILAIATLAGVGTAAATDVFDDVVDTAFYSGPVAWALDNEITTGTGEGTFEPGRALTRGEAVTFLKRYDDNVVQAAIEELPTKADLEELPTAEEVEATAEAAAASAAAEVTGLLGGVRSATIDLRLSTGETGVIAALDGASIKLECIDDSGETDIRIYSESLLDGWYSIGPGAILSSADEVEILGTFEIGPVSEEVARPPFRRGGAYVVTANGGFLSLSITSLVILESSVDSADCIFRGIAEWSEPPA